jgi:hypothetical protein
MVKKPKRKVKRYASKTEEEWRDWGEKFGKRMEKRGKEFGEEIKDLGERIGKRFEHRGKKWEKECKEWWFFSLGFIGPFIGSIFGIICLVIGIWVLNFFNVALQSNFISLLTNSVFQNIHWFFSAFLFFGYDDYFTKRYRQIYWIVKPVTGGIRILFVIWIAVWVLNTINISANSRLLAAVSNFLSINFWGIFVLVVLIGYVLMIIMKIFYNEWWMVKYD